MEELDGFVLEGGRAPDTFQRFLAVVEWTAEARGSVRLAMVAWPEMIDPQKFGGTVGPVVGDLRLQRIGILGYAGVLPVVFFLLARFLRDRSHDESDRTPAPLAEKG